MFLATHAKFFELGEWIKCLLEHFVEAEGLVRSVETTHNYCSLYPMIPDSGIDVSKEAAHETSIAKHEVNLRQRRL